MNININYFNYN